MNTTPKGRAKTTDAKPPAPAEQKGKAVTSSAPQLPEHMRGKAGKGIGNLDASDYEMPRIKLIQGISEEIQTFDGLKAGDFFHTLAEHSFGPALRIVPLYLSKRFVLWRPRPEGGILARSDDGVHWIPANATFDVQINKQGKRVKWSTKGTVAQSGLAEWGTFDPEDPNSQPAATLCYAIAAALPDFPEYSPAVLLLQRSGVAPAKKLQGKIRISGAPSYGMIFNMSSFVDQSPNGPFHNYQFAGAGFVEDKDEFNQYEIWSQQFEAMGIQVKDLEGAQDEAPAGGGSAERAAAASAAAKDGGY